MTVVKQATGVIRLGNGATTSFPVPFSATRPEDIYVERLVGNVGTRVPPSQYTISINRSAETSTVVTNFNDGPLASGERIFIGRETQPTQEVVVNSQTAYDPAIVMQVWDKLTRLGQELTNGLARAAKIPVGIEDSDGLVAQQLSQDIMDLANIQEELNSLSGVIDELVHVSQYTDDIAAVAVEAQNLYGYFQSLKGAATELQTTFIYEDGKSVYTHDDAGRPMVVSPAGARIYANGDYRLVIGRDYIINAEGRPEFLHPFDDGTLMVMDYLQRYTNNDVQQIILGVKENADRAEAAAAGAVNNAPFVVKDAAEFLGKSDLVTGARYLAKDGSGAWDVLTSGVGDFTHPVTGDAIGVVIVELSAYPNRSMPTLTNAYAKGLRDISGETLAVDDRDNLPDIDPRRMFNGTLDTLAMTDISLPDVVNLNYAKLSDARTIVETEFQPHAGGKGKYSGAMDACSFKGHEYYFVQNGSRHDQTGNAGGNSCIVAYKRGLDGTFAAQQIVAAGSSENIYLAGVSVSADGERILILIAVQSAPGGSWSGARLYVLNTADTLGTLTIVGGPYSSGLVVAGMIPYGKPLVAAGGRVILTMYAASGGGAYLYRSAAGVGAPGAFTQVMTLFPASSDEGFSGVANEVDLGFWGNLLVAVCRRQTGGTINNATYRATADLTGVSGWMPEMEMAGYPAIFPRIPQYTPKGRPLVIAATHPERSRVKFAALSSLSKVWSIKDSVNLEGGGSPTILPCTHGYGVMEYVDIGGDWGNLDSPTRVYHSYVRPDHIIHNLNELEHNLSLVGHLSDGCVVGDAAVKGNPYRFNGIFQGSGLTANGLTMWFRALRAITVSAVYLPLMAFGTAGAPIVNILDEDDNIVSAGSAGSVATGGPMRAIRCPVAQFNLVPGQVYKARLTGASIGNLSVGYNNCPTLRTPITTDDLEILGIGTSVYSPIQMPALGLEAR